MHDAAATSLVLLVCCATQVEVHKGAITPHNALQLVSTYTVVLDCTDNAPSRYLISDACVLAGKPLVSGAAIGTDGQLTVYNHGEDGEPCIWLHLVYICGVHLAAFGVHMCIFGKNTSYRLLCISYSKTGLRQKLATLHNPVYLGQWHIQSKRLSNTIGVCACRLSHTAYAV